MTVDSLLHDQGAVAVAPRVGGEVREILRYVPGSISVRYDELTGESFYSLNNAPINSADIIHLRSPLGSAPVTLCREAIALSLVMEGYAARLFGNGARPSGVLALKGTNFSADTIAKIRASWTAAHGSGKSGNTAIVSDATYTPLTLTSVDSQFLELRQFQILEIARAFRVPPHMLFDLGRATWSNVESLGREFLVFCLQPWLRAWEGALAHALLTPEERAVGLSIKFDEDDLTRGNIADRAQAYSSLIASRVLSPNEARAWEGLPPVPGGDEFVNPNITPGTPNLRSVA